MKAAYLLAIMVIILIVIIVGSYWITKDYWQVGTAIVYSSDYGVSQFHTRSFT